MRRAAPLILSLLAGLLLMHASGAKAQGGEGASSEEERADRALFERALEHFEEGRHALALDAFEELYARMEGHPRRFVLLFNLGRCHEALGHPEQAIEAYRLYLEAEGPGAEDRAEVEARVSELSRRLELRETTETSTASASETPPAPPRPFIPEPISLASSAVGLAAALAGVAVGVFIDGRLGELRSRCDPVALLCPTSLRGQVEDLEGLALEADLLLFGGGALFALGLGLSLGLADLHPFRSDARSPSEQPASLHASCSDRGCVLAMRGEF